MTRTPGASAALACIIAPSAAMIVAILRAIVEIILAFADNIRTLMQALAACCGKAALWQPARSRPMMSKPGFLPLHAFACRRSSEFGPAGTSEARMKARFAKPSAIEPDDDTDSERPTCPHVK